MSTLIYCDTNVYIDYFEDCRSGFIPLGEFSYQVFRRAIGCEFTIVVSDWLLKEVEHVGYKKEMASLLHRAKSKVVLQSLQDTDLQVARALPTHYADAVHAAIAISSGATCIVTNNIKDFLPLSHRIVCKTPRDM